MSLQAAIDFYTDIIEFPLVSSTVASLLIYTSLKIFLWNTFKFLLLSFGSLLWSLAIIAVVWGFLDGFMPAINNRKYEKASVILLIIIITSIIIILSVIKQAIYLTAFIIPVILLNFYIKRYTELPGRENYFHQN